MTTYRAWNLKPLDRSALKELTAAIAQQSTEELESRAMETMDGEPWSEEKYQMTLAAQQKEAGLLAGILAARGITDPAEALTLLSGEEELTDPMLLTDMDKACARILDAIDREETIVVFGDYDVDGVTATALLYQHLKGMGANVKCMLPSREGDGYGLSKNAIQSIHDKGCQLIVTVDNGISALEEAEFAASLGVDLIVTDHHLPHDTLPKAVAVVDPRRADDTSPFKGLCGAGVAFKLCAALDGCPPEEMLDYCGDLAAVGTVADVMPLTGENRTLVKAGLHLLQHSDRPGLLALLDEVGLGGKPVTAENVSYAIAPRINAAGRMDSAVTALQLVLCEDEERAAELAHKLNEINAARQETEGEIAKAAQAQLEAEPAILEDRVILIWGRDWHPGVIGIVASRLVEKTGRPVIVVSIDEHGEGKGSGRSVQGFNLHACIASCEDLLLRFGGHAMAAGLSVREENLPELRRRLNEWAARECPVLVTPPLECDLSIHLDRITVESVRRLDQLAPYGAENPAPVFLLEKAVVEGVYPVSEGRHCRLRLRQGNACIYAVWFGMHPEQLPYATGDVVDAALSLSVYEAARGAQLSGRILELHPDGYGFLRGASLTPSNRDIYVSMAQVRRFYLRTGDFVTGKVRPQRDGDKYSAMLYITEVNGCPADSVANRPAFDALTPCYPHEHITLEVEGGSNEFLDMRLIDLVAPIGFGQRGLIHCPPAVDKAHLLSSIANAASICHPDAVVMTLLLGGTPEDATLYRDHTHGEVIASTFDQTPENHLRITDMVLERAERLVEMKKNVILLVDSLTYLSKVYTTAAVQQGRQTIGMVNPVSLQKAKKLFGAARCLREGGSLTIFAVMNIETGSRVDDSIAEDLKGTANMELVLDTAAARAGIYPPVNLLLSGTKRAELIASKEQLDGIKLIHEMLGSLRAVDMIPQLLSMLEKTTNNEDLLVRIKDWAALMKQ